MVSLGGSIVASLENFNGFLAVYTPFDDLINIDFKQKGVVPEIMLHILQEFTFLLGRHALDNEIPHMIVCKEKTKRLHDSKIKDRAFNIGDRVLLFNSLLKIFSGKLKSYWSGPFTISHVYPYGTVELSQPHGPNFNVNGHRLKHYFGEDVPKMVIHDQTFPKDH
nr:reverse transcriptase domain-containing protein [Tanacetum cinerariifolium]